MLTLSYFLMIHHYFNLLAMKGVDYFKICYKATSGLWRYFI